jgi:hypothetical protein
MHPRTTEMENNATELGPAGALGDDVDAILHVDLTAAAPYVFPRGGAVLTSAAACGLASRIVDRVMSTTSMGQSDAAAEPASSDMGGR